MHWVVASIRVTRDFFPKAHTLPYHHARFWLNPLKEIIKTGFLQELETNINKRQPCFPNSRGPAISPGIRTQMRGDSDFAESQGLRKAGKGIKGAGTTVGGSAGGRHRMSLAQSHTDRSRSTVQLHKEAQSPPVKAAGNPPVRPHNKDN